MSQVALLPRAGCRLLQDSLPRLDELDPQELPTLAKLHMHSAGNLMATIKLLAPGVFVDGAVHPDHGRVAELEGSTLGMVNTLIELQLFQLRRASALVQHSKNKRRTTLHIVELPRRSSAPAQLESGACVECE